MARVVTPRSFLYAPGDRPELFEKAMRSGADGVVLDLEDSVLPGEKTAALQHVVEFLSDHDSRSTDTEVWVRVNNRSGLLEEELSALAGSEHLAGVSLPKVESPVDLDRLDQMLPDHVGVLGLVESASGVAAVLTIASHPRVRRLGLGEADLIADLRMTPSDDRLELMTIRVNVVVASAAAGIDQPTGPAFIDIGDEAGLVRSSEELRRLGFGGRSAIHPNQVDVLNRVFSPTRYEIEQAEELVRSMADATERKTGVFVDARGKMVDEAVMRDARQTLEAATKLGLRGGQGSEDELSDRTGSRPETNLPRKGKK